MSLISNIGTLTGLEFGLLMGFAAVDLIVLITIVITAVRSKNYDIPDTGTVYVRAAATTAPPAQPQVIVLQAPAVPVAAISPEVVSEPVYVGVSDEYDDDDDIAEVEAEEEIYDTVAIEEPVREAPEEDVAEVGLVDNDAVVFKTVRKTFDEAYAELSKEQKSFFDNILGYALSKPDAKEFRTKSNIRVRSKGGQIVKLLIRRETVVSSFTIENDMLKTYRKELAKNDGTKITVKATDVTIVDVDTFEAAKGLVDVAYDQLVHERELQKEARKERRRQAREACRMGADI